MLIDRDGVVNDDGGDFVRSASEFVPIPGSLEAIARLNAAGLSVALVTNQSGIARGYLDLKILDSIHAAMAEALGCVGGHVDRIFVCPHGPEDGCGCRKPAPGLILEAMSEFGIGAGETIFIGDRRSDLEAAQTATCHAMLTRTGRGEEFVDYANERGLPVVADLSGAVDALLDLRSDGSPS